MVDPDIVATRLLKLNEALGHLERHGPVNVERLTGNAMLSAAVERWLQIAIEACVDIAFHVIASEGWQPPESGRAAFVSLAQHGVIEAPLAERLGGAYSLRNVLVHEYATVDLDKIAHAVQHDLGDLRSFAIAIQTLL